MIAIALETSRSCVQGQVLPSKMSCVPFKFISTICVEGSKPQWGFPPSFCLHRDDLKWSPNLNGVFVSQGLDQWYGENFALELLSYIQYRVKHLNAKHHWPLMKASISLHSCIQENTFAWVWSERAGICTHTCVSVKMKRQELKIQRQ